MGCVDCPSANTLYMPFFHDADDEEFGQKRSFVQVEPREDVEDPVIVVTWGDLLAPINTIFAVRGL